MFFRRVLVVSMACLIFTAVNNANLGIINQLAQQNDNHWIGPLSIGLIFLGSGLAAIYNKYIGKYPYNRIIFVGGLGWDVYCGFSVLFLFIGFENYVNFIIVIGSLICGITVSLFYNGIFNYINQCGKRDQCTKKYFGLSLCINQSANLLGSGFSSLLIKPLGQKYYSILMFCLSVVSSLSFIFFKNFKEEQGRNQEETKSDTILSERQKQEEISEGLLSKKQKKVPWSLFFCFGLSGVIITFVFSQLSLLFYRYFPERQKEEVNHLTFIALMIEGCGQFMGGFILAIFSKKIKNLSIAYTANGCLFLVSLGLFYIGFQNQYMWLIYIASFIVGFTDCFCMSLAVSIGGFWKEKGISLYNAGQSITVAALSVPIIFLDFPLMSAIYAGLFVLSTLSLCLNRRVMKEIHINESQ